MEDVYYGQEGAAMYRTSHGDFIALFLPTSQDWSGLQVRSIYENNGIYAYFFRGKPRLRGPRFEGRKMYFVPYANVQFAIYDSELANRLNEMFNSARSIGSKRGQRCPGQQRRTLAEAV
jgi:hypothetical protein